ncbi:MAG: sel1 repeat family protein [Verrucomicrobia subdivision 3 bacterium]|nr:sel1 repeat family protein [Limisphaerales bacterium]
MREKQTERFIYAMVALAFILLLAGSGCGKSKAQAQAEANAKAKALAAEAEAMRADPEDKLGQAYDHYSGNGTPIDYERAALLFRQLAEEGHAVAQFSLGAMFQNGQGVPQNYMEAVKWYQKSAMGNHPDGQYLLGLALKEGSGVPRDRIEAFKWLQLAAEGNKKYIEARDELALLLPAEMVAEGKRRAEEHHQYHSAGK